MPNNTQKHERYVEITFLMTNGDVVSKRVYESRGGINGTISQAIEDLEISPFLIKEIGIECILVKKRIFQLSRAVIDDIVNSHIAFSVDQIIH